MFAVGHAEVSGAVSKGKACRKLLRSPFERAAEIIFEAMKKDSLHVQRGGSGGPPPRGLAPSEKKNVFVHQCVHRRTPFRFPVM